MTPKRCPDCKDLHGKIYRRNEPITPERPLHSFCRCFIVWLKAILAGMATEQGRNGADWWLKNYKKLPPYYISAEYDCRNSRRIVYSNDGLIFATYNHYKTFIEII